MPIAIHVLPQLPFTTTTFIAQTVRVTADAGWFPYVLAGRRRWYLRESTSVGTARTEMLRPSPKSAWAGIERLPHGLRDSLTLAQGHELARRASRYASGPTVIHAHFAARSFDIAIEAKKESGLPLVVTVHAADVFGNGRIEFLRSRLANADAIIAISERGYRYVGSLNVGTRLELIPCSIPLESIPTHSGEGPAHVVTVGRLVEKKGVDVLVDLAERVLRAQPQLHWTIVGDGPLRPLVKSLSVRQPRFQHISKLPHNEVLDLVAGARAFVLPSRRSRDGDEEGVPIGILEAMAIGTPVVAGRSGGVEEVVVPGETGYLLSADEDPIDEWVGALTSALEGDGERLAATARKRIREERQPAVEGEAYSHLYRDLAEGTG